MATFESRRPSKVRPRVDFNMNEYRKLVFAKGIDLEWEQCAECPCSRDSTSFTLNLIESTSQTTGEARSDCTLCEGVGYFWHSAQPIRAIVTGGSSSTDKYAVYGEYARGMVSISTLPEHLSAYGDRFTVLNSVMVFRETRTRTAQAVESLRYPIQARTLDLENGVQIVRVLRLQYADAQGLSTLNKSLTEGVDFEITAQGAIDFSVGDALGTTPTQGQRFSVSYFARPRYYVADHPHTHRDSVYIRKSTTESALTLPVQVHCSLEFMGI